MRAYARQYEALISRRLRGKYFCDMKKHGAGELRKKISLEFVVILWYNVREMHSVNE